MSPQPSPQSASRVQYEGEVSATSPKSPSATPEQATRPDRLDTFARRLDYLFRSVHPGRSRPFSYEHVAEAIREQGIDISANYIWMLRSGRRDNPTLRHMEGLARFFGVSAAFLSDTDEAERVRQEDASSRVQTNQVLVTVEALLRDVRQLVLALDHERDATTT